MKLSIIVPVFNEEEVVTEFIKRAVLAISTDFKKFSYEIIFVDDGSTDATLKKIISVKKSNRNIKVLQLSRNFGHHVAISAGLSVSTGDYVVMMDGDLQDRPEDIKKLYSKMLKGYDVVYAVRKNVKFTIFKKVNSWFFNKLIRMLVEKEIIINSTIFRIMTKKVVENLNLIHEKNRYVIGLIGWVGFKHAGQVVTHGKRYASKTKYPLSKQLDLALDAIFSFSTYPLRKVIMLGVIFILIACGLIVFALFRKIVFGTAFIGWTSLLISILSIGGVQIILLGIIAEYIARIYIETKNRPLFIVKRFYK